MADCDADRFDAALRARVRKNLAGFERQPIAPDGRRPAAVAVVLLPDEEGRACFLLTRRTATLRAHARQWALPGGRIDAGEIAQAAALRELREEVVSARRRPALGSRRLRHALEAPSPATGDAPRAPRSHPGQDRRRRMRSRTCIACP
jgi:hypothetical protein